LKDYEKIMEIRENIGTALRKYMFGKHPLNIFLRFGSVETVHFI